MTLENRLLRGGATPAEEEHYHALVSSGYVRREAGWKLMFHHQTPLESDGVSS